MRQNIIDLPAATEARLISWVNEAQLELESYHRWLGLEATWQTITVAGSNTLVDYTTSSSVKPSDWLHAHGDPYWRPGAGGDDQFCEWSPSIQDVRKDYKQSAATTNRGKPRTLWEQSSRIYVYPTPDAENPVGTYSIAGEYNILIPYRARADVLVAGSSITNFFTADPDLALYLEDYATGQAMLFNRDFDNANVYLLKARGHALRAKRMDKQRRFQSYRHTPRRDVYASRRQSRAV